MHNPEDKEKEFNKATKSFDLVIIAPDNPTKLTLRKFQPPRTFLKSTSKRELAPIVSWSKNMLAFNFDHMI